ncbi:hypothetical protein LTR84_003057 [Exophiala bonariae]|uniref:Uncharacterized protein n=1 Tax=Exophiala bonariae TaxID=1690606 RepID=A0AAV9NCC1_9EURO|nr:hypothetical protein LTR84_003057 [Exophiala bonariae]
MSKESDSTTPYWQYLDRNTHNTAKALLQYIARPFEGKKTVAKGFVYVLQEQKKGYIKIGSSGDTGWARPDAIKNCRITPIESLRTPRFHGALRCEKIVQKILEHRAKDLHDCRCGKVELHLEWFHVEFKFALVIVELVYTWMLDLPYDTSNEGAGELKDTWQRALESFQNDLKGQFPKDLKDFFRKDDWQRHHNHCDWEENMVRVDCPRDFDIPTRPNFLGIAELLTEDTNDLTVAHLEKNDRRPMAVGTTLNSRKNPTPSKNDTTQCLSTPPRQPAHRYPLRSRDRPKTAPPGSGKGKFREMEETLPASAPLESRFSDKHDFFDETPSKPGSRTKYKATGSSHILYRAKVNESEDESVDDDNDENEDEDYTVPESSSDDDGDGSESPCEEETEEEDKEHDDDNDDDEDEDESEEEVGSGSEEAETEEDVETGIDFNSHPGSRFKETLDLLKRNRKLPVQKMHVKLVKDKPKVKDSKQYITISSDSEEQTASDSDSTPQQAKDSRIVGPSARMANKIPQSLPRFNIDEVGDSAASARGDPKSDASRLKKPRAKHGRGRSLVESDIRSLAGNELVRRPRRASAATSATEVIGTFAQLGKEALVAGANITFNVNINYGTTYKR